jgi:hypothetical protein
LRTREAAPQLERLAQWCLRLRESHEVVQYDAVEFQYACKLGVTIRVCGSQNVDGFPD